MSILKMNVKNMPNYKNARISHSQGQPSGTIKNFKNKKNIKREYVLLMLYLWTTCECLSLILFCCTLTKSFDSPKSCLRIVNNGNSTYNMKISLFLTIRRPSIQKSPIPVVIRNQSLPFRRSEQVLWYIIVFTINNY